MDCPRCGAHNESDVGSCLSCGAAISESENLPTIAQKPHGPPSSPAKAAAPRLAQGAPPKQCPNCMTLNAATFKFCARCGTPLGATAAPGASAPKSAAAPAKSAPPPKPPAPVKPATPARPVPPPPPKPVTGQSRPPPAPPKPAAPVRPRARVSAIARDGTRSADFVLVKDETRVGRDVEPTEVKLDKDPRSEEHTPELQSPCNLVCRL